MDWQEKKETPVGTEILGQEFCYSVLLVFTSFCFRFWMWLEWSIRSFIGPTRCNSTTRKITTTDSKIGSCIWATGPLHFALVVTLIFFHCYAIFTRRRFFPLHLLMIITYSVHVYVEAMINESFHWIFVSHFVFDISSHSRRVVWISYLCNARRTNNTHALQTHTHT